MTNQDEPRRHANTMPQADGAAVPTADAGEASDHLGQGDGDDVDRNKGGPSTQPPRQPGGLASGLQPGGTSPGGGPGASAGSIGTGGASTGGGSSGSVKKSGI